ncbi:unnamed protein product [Adineta ricciae]|uniref:Nuclear receptor domain-containing protein n=1 Tax=Adineta ricciae TaxID=249248 RepID=A0A814ME63_ADIRI|nr:unnamed protein product [Adineta ricciae]CAF1078319.1 unnamed protein product [Adineta ricciae]
MYRKANMNGQTKMIIITSDEDLIRQLALHKRPDTRIVDLDRPNQHLAANPNENDMIDLAFLAEFSTHDAKSDQVYKRALDSEHESRPKQARGSRKSADLICAICGDRAVGFNYDALSCASCKAFFRRNANQSRDKLRCYTNQGQCSVSHETHRKCPRCRLDRCFAVGMRKDFILSEEEKQRRKKRLEENRSATEKHNSSPPSIPANEEPLDDIDRLLLNLNEPNSEDSIGIESLLFDTLSIEDWIAIESIRSSFIATFKNIHQPFCTAEVSDRDSALVAWSHNTSQMSLHFIEFFRHIEEFENLSCSDDRFLLIKFNILSVFSVYKCYIHGTEALNFTPEQEEKHRLFFELCGDTGDLMKTFVEIKLTLVQLTNQDPAALALIMTIILFTDHLAVDEKQPSLNDPIAVGRAQIHYTKLLWNYVANKQGEAQAHKFFIDMLAIMFRIQTCSRKFRTFFRNQLSASNISDKIAPLMQAVLNIS